MLRESARLAASTGAYWQTHLAEDRDEIAEVRRLFPDALDYLDVYDRAGALGPRTILAHAVHLSERETARLAGSGARVAHCPESNLFLPRGRCRWTGTSGGRHRGSASAPTWPAGRTSSIFRAMRVGAYVQNARRVATLDVGADPRPARLAAARHARGRARARAGGRDRLDRDGQGGRPHRRSTRAMTDPLDGGAGAHELGPGPLTDPSDLLSRLIFRSHPDMVRGAWVRGRLLDGAGRVTDLQHDDGAAAWIVSPAQCRQRGAGGQREHLGQASP